MTDVSQVKSTPMMNNNRKTRHANPQNLMQFAASLFCNRGIDSKPPFASDCPVDGLEVQLKTEQPPTTLGDKHVELTLTCKMSRHEGNQVRKFLSPVSRDRVAERRSFGSGARKHLPVIPRDRKNGSKSASQVIWEMKMERGTDTSDIARALSCPPATVERLEREGIPADDMPLAILSRLSELSSVPLTEMLEFDVPPEFFPSDFYQYAFEESVRDVARHIRHPKLNVSIREFRGIYPTIVSGYRRYVEARSSPISTKHRLMREGTCFTSDDCMRMLGEFRRQERSNEPTIS